jgi:adenine-specific DNA-methyltransferase
MPNGTHGTKRAKGKAAVKTTEAKPYKHPESESPMRPEVGTQARFNKRLPAQKYRYDSSLSPAMDFDGQNPERPLGEWLLARIKEAAALPAPHVFKKPQEFKTTDGSVVCTVAGLQDAVARLAAIEKPFLNWAGKAERLSFDVPTLPLFIHERLSTKAIIETLKGHRIDKQETLFDLFGDPQHPIFEQALRAYEHKDQWVNRMILGDSLVVMNSLLRYESLGGQVQMIYIDPPYGVKFGSNFQPFVRNRDVKHNDDENMTREPEMVQAYRDTWELGVHSYLTYLRDRLLVSRELLAPSGSIFVQISDENLHHVREVMDEVFGAENFVSVVTFVKTSAQEADELPSVCDYILWYARDRERLKFRALYEPKGGEAGASEYDRIELPDGSRRKMTREERENWNVLPAGAKPYRQDNIVSQRPPGDFPVEFEGEVYRPITGYWKTGLEGMKALIEARRIEKRGKMLSYVRFFGDFPLKIIPNFWPDVRFSSRSEDKFYVVQTALRVIERCLLMTTDPGDLVLDPTCGSGTTAYVAEQWGRRWITIDTSRVPLALARQRLLTSTFPWFELTDERRGPISGFVYRRKQNQRGEDVGGIVPHVMLKSIANTEPPGEEVLVDRPDQKDSITRVTGPFCVEATIPTALDSAEQQQSAPTMDDDTPYIVRMLEVLRRSPVLRVEGNKTVTLKNVRPPAKSLLLNAEAVVDATAPGQNPTLEDAVREAAEKNGKALPLSQRSVAFVFGPENAAVSQRLVDEAAREAHLKGYSHLYVIGFQIDPHARTLIEKNADMGGIPTTYVQATHDLMMGDLLKNMRSSQIFSVCGMPEIKLKRLKTKDKDGSPQYEVNLLGLDVFDPSTMETEHRSGNDVPAWFLDANYNGLCFHVSQAFFPRTGAWDSLKKALKGEYEESVWEHLAGDTSAPFELADQKQIAVKVIDDRGNELIVTKTMDEAV